MTIKRFTFTGQSGQAGQRVFLFRILGNLRKAARRTVDQESSSPQWMVSLTSLRDSGISCCVDCGLAEDGRAHGDMLPLLRSSKEDVKNEVGDTNAEERNRSFEDGHSQADLGNEKKTQFAKNQSAAADGLQRGYSIEILRELRVPPPALNLMRQGLSKRSILRRGCSSMVRAEDS